MESVNDYIDEVGRKSVDSPFEYGIRHKRDFEMHCTGFQTYKEALNWMTEGWDDLDPSRIYEIVRRPIGKWSAVTAGDCSAGHFDGPVLR